MFIWFVFSTVLHGRRECCDVKHPLPSGVTVGAIGGLTFAIAWLPLSSATMHTRAPYPLPPKNDRQASLFHQVPFA